MLKGYLMMLAFKQANVPVAVQARDTAAGLIGRANAREKAHGSEVNDKNAGDAEPIQIPANKAFTTGVISRR